MTPKAFDPNNHAPQVSADDRWGDDEEVSPKEDSTPIILPIRRNLLNQPTAKTPAEIGLRIEPNLARDTFENSPQRIEILEVNREVIRLENPLERPTRVTRRFTFQKKQMPLPISESEKGENQDWGGTQHRSLRWMMVMAATVTLLLIVGLLLLPSINSPNAPRADSTKGTLTVVEEEKIAGMETMNQLLEKQPEALQIFRSYAQAAHSDEVIPLIVDGRIIRDSVRKHWRPLGVPNDWTPQADAAWSVMEFGGRGFGLLEGRLPDQSSFTAYFTYQNENFLLDWKATTAFGTATFRDLSKGRGDASEIRGVISRDHFYSAAWPEEDYRSYRFTSPNEESTIWCYARRGEKADDALVPLFTSGEITGKQDSERKVTLKLGRGSDDALPNQWLIEDLLHIDWGTH